MSSAAALSLANARLGSAGDLGAWLEADGALEPEERAEVAHIAAATRPPRIAITLQRCLRSARRHARRGPDT